MYYQVVDECKDSPWRTWQDVYNASQKKPSQVLDHILADQNAELCLSWIDLHSVTSTYNYLIDSRYVFQNAFRCILRISIHKKITIFPLGSLCYF